MTALPALPRYTPREEIANAVIHGLGIVLAIVGLTVLTTFAALHGDAIDVAACAVFGATLVLCYTASTLYHGIPIERARRVLRALDHSSIFLLIAGTYTPFMLVNLRGPWGWSLLAAIWTLALTGIVLRLLLRGRLHGLVVSLYIAMGWAVVVAVKPMLEHVAAGGLALLAAGGLAYTGGVVFYKWRLLPYHHAIWHGFVLLGSALHYFAVLFYVIPWPAAA
ncbi:MAG: hemolysin III family protein [Rhodocyclaceae bacterium]|nr:hemolysin III family protein [Rhodocyclaceae bacterium]